MRLKFYLSESKDLKLYLKSMLKLFAMNDMAEKQVKWYEWMDSVAKSVHCRSYKSDPDLENLIENFLRYSSPEMKECYRNSWKISVMYPREIEFVGGYTSALGVPIEHAWNYYKPKKIYFDLTFELALGKKTENENYLQILKVKPAIATKILSTSMFAVSGLLGTYYYKNVFKG